MRSMPAANGRFAQISGFKFGFRDDIRNILARVKGVRRKVEDQEAQAEWRKERERREAREAAEKKEKEQKSAAP